jgi:thymidylate kinase
MIQSPSRALVVEFISTPGAGKTTFMPVVKEFFASHKLHAWSVVEASRPFAKRTKIGKLVDSWSPSSLKDPLLWQVFYQTSRLHRTAFRRENQELLYSVLRFQRTRPISRADRQHVLHWFTNLTGQYHFLRQYSRANDVLIFDEGFIHRVVQLFASEDETLDDIYIQSYLNLLPVPDLIIIPQASLETCVERIYRRGIWKRFKDRDMRSVFRFMSNAHDAVSLAMDHIHARGWPVIHIINEHQPVADISRQLRQKLADHYMSTPKNIFMQISA